MNLIGVRSLCQTVKQRLQQWTRPDSHALILNAVLDLTRSKSELVLENALLRQQLIVFERQSKRPRLTWRDRSLIVLLASKLRTWKEALLIVQPDTVSFSSVSGGASPGPRPSRAALL